MYSVNDGYKAAEQRIRRLLAGKFNSEALVTAVFTAEKTLRRTLKELVVRSGFISPHADEIIKRMKGLDAIKENWRFFDPHHRKLTDLVPQTNWQAVKVAAEMRNDMVHGECVYTSQKCVDSANAVLTAIEVFISTFDREYCYSGWTKHRKRTKSGLHLAPQKRTT